MTTTQEEAATGWQNHIVGYRMVDPRTLVPNAKNPRTHSKDQRSALEGSLDELGWIDEITVNQVTGHMTDGHARLALALARGEALVPVRDINLPEEKERLALIAKDRIGQLAGYDTHLLAGLLAETQSANGPLAQLLKDMGEEFAANAVGPRSLDDLADQYPEPDPSTFWPVIEIKVPPEVHARYLGLMDRYTGASDADKFSTILARAERP